MLYNGNSFFIKTDELVPHEYYVDIKVNYDEEELVTKNALHFIVAGNGRTEE